MIVKLNQLPEVLRQLREEKKKFQTDLKEVATAAYVSDIENGKRPSNVIAVGRLEKWFGELGYTLELRIVEKK